VVTAAGTSPLHLPDHLRCTGVIIRPEIDRTALPSSIANRWLAVWPTIAVAWSECTSNADRVAKIVKRWRLAQSCCGGLLRLTRHSRATSPFVRSFRSSPSTHRSRSCSECRPRSPTSRSTTSRSVARAVGDDHVTAVVCVGRVIDLYAHVPAVDIERDGLRPERQRRASCTSYGVQQLDRSARIDGPRVAIEIRPAAGRCG